VPVRLALDQNFPTPILSALADYMPEVELVPLLKIDHRMPDLQDRELIIALHQAGWAGLVTNNYKMLRVPRELAAIMRTHLGVFAIEGVGDDPVRATGALLLDLPGVLKDFVPGKGDIYWLKPRRPPRKEPWDLFTEAASRYKRLGRELYEEVKVTDAEMATPLLD
jgi:hypothetical protein